MRRKTKGGAMIKLVLATAFATGVFLSSPVYAATPDPNDTSNAGTTGGPNSTGSTAPDKLDHNKNLGTVDTSKTGKGMQSTAPGQPKGAGTVGEQPKQP
jgi:hypothetical protein